MRHSPESLVLAGFLAAAGIASTSHAGTILSLAGEGFTYETPDLSADFLAIGEGLEAVGVVSEVGPYLIAHVHFATHEYTFHLSGLSVTDRSFDAPSQTLFVEFADARVRFHEDPRVGGTSAAYGTNPPNGTAPSTFIDGQLVLGGDVDNFRLLFDFVFDSGEFVGDVRGDEGAYFIGNYFGPFGPWDWWFRGYLGYPDTPVPTGYAGSATAAWTRPAGLPAQRQTWGAIKKTYR